MCVPHQRGPVIYSSQPMIDPGWSKQDCLLEHTQPSWSRTAVNKEPAAQSPTLLPEQSRPGQAAGRASCFPPLPKVLQPLQTALVCRAQEWVQQRGLAPPRLREVIAWPSNQPWPAWADHLFPGGLCNTVNTRQFPSANVLNWCCAWALQHPHAAEVPVVSPRGI